MLGYWQNININILIHIPQYVIRYSFDVNQRRLKSVELIPVFGVSKDTDVCDPHVSGLSPELDLTGDILHTPSLCASLPSKQVSFEIED